MLKNYNHLLLMYSICERSWDDIIPCPILYWMNSKVNVAHCCLCGCWIEPTCHIPSLLLQIMLYDMTLNILVFVLLPFHYSALHYLLKLNHFATTHPSIKIVLWRHRSRTFYVFCVIFRLIVVVQPAVYSAISEIQRT